MSRRSSFAVPVLLGLLVAACADNAPVEPGAVVSPSASLASGAYADLPGLSAPYAVYFQPGKGAALVDAAVAAGGEVQLYNDRFGFAMVSGIGEAEAVTLRAVQGVDEVELDELVPIDEQMSDELEGGVGIASPEAPNTAFFYPRQWHLQVIEAQAAWDAGKTGSPVVTVAVLDGGIGYTHADLAGLVDLDRSVSFLPIESGFLQQVFPGAHPVADLQYHGTHVAATISSNASAAAGVTSRTTLMGVKVCYGVTLTSGGQQITRAGSCLGTAILAGIVHAVDNGADVINMSLGGAFLRRQSKGYVATLARIFNYANQNDALVVVAAGNDASDLDAHEFRGVIYPSLYKTYCDAPNVVCVSATGPTGGPLNGPWENIDNLAPYSNYGRSAITVAAPGGAARRVTAACTPFSLAVPICQTGTFVVGINGTSMATPHVSGLAALLYAEGLNKSSQVRNAIGQSADDLGQPGRDPFYGRGRINVRKALGL